MNDKALNDILNITHVPQDAGDHAEDLYRILARIPENWGRWISCASGWYPLVIELDQKLAEIAPDYTLHQVKEKFGTLRYYIGFPDLQPQCCIDLDAEQPIEGPINPRFLNKDEKRTAENQYTLDRWFYEVLLPHFDSPEHIQQNEDLEPERQRRLELSKKMHKIINDYENLSSRTCELCGAEAEMRARHYWYRTLCEPCAEKDGYIPILKEDNEDDN